MIAVDHARGFTDRIVITPGGTPPPDAAATDFITRAGITVTNQKVAINSLVVSLKSAGLWTKIRALYPFVGGTSSSHTHNLMSASYPISWVSVAGGVGMIHDSMGVKGDGFWYGTTTLNLNTFTVGSLAFAAYRNTRVGNYGAGGEVQFYETGKNYEVRSRNGAGNFTSNLGAEGQQVSYTPTPDPYDSRGFWLISRTTATLETGYLNGVSVGTNSTAQGTLPSGVVEIFSRWQTDAGSGLAMISDGLSAAEVATLYTIVTAYQTSLGRQN